MITVIQTLEPVAARLRSLLGYSAHTITAYRRAHELALEQADMPMQPHHNALPLLMGVNHGRWCATCHECSTGVATGKLWREARCFACGAIFATVWPDEHQMIERILLKRPLKNRNWEPGEALNELRAQNIEHGLEA